MYESILATLREQRDKLQMAIDALGGPTQKSETGAKPRKKLSAASIKAMVEGRKRARAAKLLESQNGGEKRGARVISAAARKRMAEATRQRWAKVREQKAAEANSPRVVEVNEEQPETVEQILQNV